MFVILESEPSAVFRRDMPSWAFFWACFRPRMLALRFEATNMPAASSAAQFTLYPVLMRSNAVFRLNDARLRFLWVVSTGIYCRCVNRRTLLYFLLLSERL